MRKPKQPEPPEPLKREENISVRASGELKAALVRVARAEERTLSQMAEIILRRWLQEKGELK
jgi:RNase H-fold protein (predicted Holliday junction resolvase)